MTHTGEKLHMCTQCNFSSITASALKKHNMKHTGEKLHNCKACTYSTAYTSCLKNHMRIHLGEEPFTCSVCIKSFLQDNHLKNAHDSAPRAFDLLCMQQILCSKIIFENAHGSTHWGEALYLLCMQQVFPSKVQFKQTCPRTPTYGLNHFYVSKYFDKKSEMF